MPLGTGRDSLARYLAPRRVTTCCVERFGALQDAAEQLWRLQTDKARPHARPCAAVSWQILSLLAARRSAGTGADRLLRACSPQPLATFMQQWQEAVPEVGGCALPAAHARS